MNRVVMNAILGKLGYRLHLATNGREAVEAVRRESYAAVLMDIMMPEMDGYEATAAIRAYEHERQGPSSRRRLPIIAVTAVAIQGAREQCIAAGMDDFLSKPVVAESVAEVLDHWISNAGEEASWEPELAAAPAEPEDEPIDRQALDSLRELDPDDSAGLVAEVVNDFIGEVSRRFDVLRSAAASGDSATLTHELHFIAGCASVVGATQVEKLARSLEAGDPRDATGAPLDASALVTRLEQAFGRARIALESIVAASPQGTLRPAPEPT
jgi:CheY-like chemotaxis protein